MIKFTHEIHFLRNSLSLTEDRHCNAIQKQPRLTMFLKVKHYWTTEQSEDTVIGQQQYQQQT